MGEILLDRLPHNLKLLDLSHNVMPTMSGTGPQSLESMFADSWGLHKRFLVVTLPWNRYLSNNGFRSIPEELFSFQSLRKLFVPLVYTFLLLAFFIDSNHRDISNNMIKKANRLPQGLKFLFVSPNRLDNAIANRFTKRTQEFVKQRAHNNVKKRPEKHRKSASFVCSNSLQKHHIIHLTFFLNGSPQRFKS